MNTSIQGQCNCGAVTFELLTSIQSMYKCYCTLCQKQSGTASNAATLVLPSNFRWHSGEEAISVWKKDTGFNSHFCSTCGSPVPNEIGANYIWVPMGLMGSVDADIVVILFEGTMPRWEGACCNNEQSGVNNVDELFERLTKHVRK